MEKELESAVAPAFCLPASDGTNVCLEDFRGKV
ncbi:MAG: hypothetical protein JWN30_2879, partial [Bacilli bacterium]|nr:hypothetical protein [Bacilli bacterium]